MKSYEMNLEVSAFKNGVATTEKQSAEINLSDDTRFESILDFMDSVKAVWKRARKAIKSGDRITMEVIVSTYEGWSNPDEKLRQTSFDRWYCTEEGQDDEGIYLRPDIRYTDAYRDMYLGKDVLRGLAFTL